MIDDCCRENPCLVVDTSISGARVSCELDAVMRIYGKPACIVSDNLLAREENAVLRIGSRGIRANRCLEISCPGGLRRQEVVSAIVNTGSARLLPSPSLRQDPKSQADRGGSENCPGDSFPGDAEHYRGGRVTRLHGRLGERSFRQGSPLPRRGVGFAGFDHGVNGAPPWLRWRYRLCTEDPDCGDLAQYSARICRGSC